MPDIGSSSFSETDASNNSASPSGAPEGMAPSGVNDTIRAGWGGLKRFWNRINGVKTTSGTNTITVSYDVAEASLYTGERLMVKLGGTNTGAATFSANSLTAKNVKNLLGGDPASGALVSGQHVELMYDGTNQLHMNPEHPIMVYNETVTTQASISIPIRTTYKNLVIEGTGMSMSADAGILLIRVSIAAAVKSDGTYYNNQSLWGNDGASVISEETSTAHAMSRAVDNANFSGIASWGFNFDAKIWNCQNATLFKRIRTECEYINNAGPVYESMINNGRYTGAAGALDAIELSVASGTFSGHVRAWADRA